MTIERVARAAREASIDVANLPGEVRNSVLLDLAEGVLARKIDILSANAEDMATSETVGLDAPKLKRLKLTSVSLAQMAAGLRQVASLQDPVGEVTRSYTVPSGLEVKKVRTPLGVIAMIYEARPSVTVDAFALCFKAGNSCVLKGGKEADNSNRLLSSIIKETLESHGVPADAMSAITSSDRNELRQLLTLHDDIDLVIPRGGAGLIRFVHEHSRIPTIQHFHGVCHVYVDSSADLDKAIEIVVTGKASAPATCNATECVLIHKDVSDEFIPKLVDRATAEGVEIRGDEQCREIGGSSVQNATNEDYGAEFLDLVLAAKIVDSFDEAVNHIEKFSSNHTEAVLAEDTSIAEEFCRKVRSSCVLVNASTRFNDGFQLGLGAEIGISTNRIHAYGPMGLEGLTIERYIVHGQGQVR
jgi:glutamate-5-semialdehyde dehydrogenase